MRGFFERRGREGFAKSAEGRKRRPKKPKRRAKFEKIEIRLYCFKLLS
jgi:hypothetical protein